MSNDLLGSPTHLRGIVDGMTVAIQMIRQMAAEEKNKHSRIELSREQMLDVRKRCVSALNQFKRGSPARAKQALEKLVSRLGGSNAL